MPEMKEVKFEIDVTPDDSGVFYSAHELPSREGCLEIGKNAMVALGISPGDTIWLSARKVEKLARFIQMPESFRDKYYMCPLCGYRAVFPRETAHFAECPHYGMTPSLQHMEWNALLAGQVTEVEA